MTKPASFRLGADVLQMLEERAKTAGVSKTDYLTSLIVGEPAESQVTESEWVAGMLANAVQAEAEKAALRAEIRELKRKLGMARQPDAPSESISRSIERPQNEPVIPQHIAHSGVMPVSGCEICAGQAKLLGLRGVKSEMASVAADGLAILERAKERIEARKGDLDRPRQSFPKPGAKK